MWRRWIIAGLVAVTLVAVACGDGTHDLGPCVSDEGESEWGLSSPPANAGGEFYEELYRTYDARLDVDLGETAELTLSIRNKTDEAQTLIALYRTPADFSISFGDSCLSFWPTWGHLKGPMRLHFEPGEEKVYTEEWDFLLNGMEIASAGEYIAYAFVGLHVGVDEEDIDSYGMITAFKRFRVSNKHLRAAHIEHPPAPMESTCGDPLDASRREIEQWIEHGETPYSLAYATIVLEVDGGELRAIRDRDDRLIRVYPWTLLDENRQPVNAFGIRAVVSEPPPREWNLPTCLDGVPVQVVVKSDGYP